MLDRPRPTECTENKFNIGQKGRVHRADVAEIGDSSF